MMSRQNHHHGVVILGIGIVANPCHVAIVVAIDSPAVGQLVGAAVDERQVHLVEG